VWFAAAVALPAQTFTTLLRFNFANGGNPHSGLIQGADGNLFGTAFDGGTTEFQVGTVFSITREGRVAGLYSFCPSQAACPSGPQAGLVQGIDGNFYGTTYSGGTHENGGTVFKITPNGTLTMLHSFGAGGSDGFRPQSELVQGIDGNFYGTTTLGGTNNEGTVFKITPKGALTTLYSFCPQSGCADGASPEAGVLQGADGNFYGTTFEGGASVSCRFGCGTVFKVSPNGALTTLYTFCSQDGCADGTEPVAGLILGADGNFYGTTLEGGANGYGTVFKITPSGALTTLYTFCSQDGCAQGAYPEAGLVQGADGNFYGTTAEGGAGGSCLGNIGCGTVFEITPGGTLTTLYDFCAHGRIDCPDGAAPYARLLQATDGDFYGTTSGGGDDRCYDENRGEIATTCGTVFRVSVGLGPFVKTNPGFGKVGAKVGILGTDLNGATSVTFNGTAAGFTVKSRTLIIATVPKGASSGEVKVKLPGVTLSSNVPFYVLK
jgi:uncharacterized repeat protein (TIGR03803 family)